MEREREIAKEREKDGPNKPGAISSVSGTLFCKKQKKEGREERRRRKEEKKRGGRTS